jgi:hypothetical protein
MKTLFAALIALSLTACTKKVESAPGPVNPQITDSVTQVVQPVEAVDTGAAPVSEVKPDPDPKPVEVQSVPVSK